jgi:hypothetical protein
MKICVEIFMEDNSFVKKTFTVTNEPLISLKEKIFEELKINIYYQEWYLDGEILNDDFNDWKKGNYILFINNDIIEIKFLINNNITNIYVNKNTTVKELKNILSLNDNIYIRNILLDDNQPISNYNIKIPLFVNNKLSSSNI